MISFRYKPDLFYLQQHIVYLSYYKFTFDSQIQIWGRCGSDRMVYSVQHYVIKFVSYLRLVGDFLHQ